MRTSFQYLRSISGRWSRSNLLETPLRLLTNDEAECFGAALWPSCLLVVGLALMLAASRYSPLKMGLARWWGHHS